MPTTLAPARRAEPARDAPARAAHRRSLTERCVALAERLPADQRVLVHQVLDRGLTFNEIATLAGCTPAHVRRRYKRCLTRLSDPLFAFLEFHARSLSPDERRTAQAVLYRGLSLRAAAAELGLSLHAVRMHMRSLRALARRS